MEAAVASESILRVQALAQAGLVPSQYIQPPKNRPESNHKSSSAGIPVIDLFDFAPQHSETMVHEIGQACRDWGAFHVTNHGIPNQLLNEMRNAGLDFFNEYSMQEKQKYSCDENIAASEGYGSRLLVKEDSILDWRDYFYHHTLPLSRRTTSNWPEFYRGIAAEYSDRMKALASKLLSMISESLSLPPSFIEDALGEIDQNITINYYPPCPQPDLTLGLQSHSDMGGITLLIQDEVGGLEVLKDDEWVTAQPLSNAILIIIGDQIEIITNGQYPSAQHRAVTNAHKSRLSVATFHDPAKSRKIHPAAPLTSEQCPARYRQVEYGDYIFSWYTKGPDGRRNINALLL